MVFLFIAQSLDGYIAAPDGDIAFLSQVEAAGEDYGYTDFFRAVGTVIIGRKTYEKVLGFGEPFPYRGKTCYVLTRTPRENTADVTFYTGDVPTLIRRLKNESTEHIFVDGGGEAILAMMAHGLVDRYIVSVVPTLLGDGIPLFRPGFSAQKLRLLRATTFPSGLVQLWYANDNR